MKRQNKTSRSLLSFLMIMVIALLASCSGNTPESPAKADTKPETETVRLAVFRHGHILNAIAEAQGYLEDEGIKVEYVHVETDAEVFEGIKNGTIDVASNSGTNLPLQQIADGQDLTIFGGTRDTILLKMSNGTILKTRTTVSKPSRKAKRITGWSVRSSIMILTAIPSSKYALMQAIFFRTIRAAVWKQTRNG